MISEITEAPPAIANDPLLASEPLPLTAELRALGFRVSLESNNARLLEIARSSWPVATSSDADTNIRLQIGVRESDEMPCPEAPILRANGHLMTSVCDNENFMAHDLDAGFAFGWVSSSVLKYPEFLRYHLIDASILTLLTCKYLTPLHAASVSYAGRGILLHGRSGAGKSTLAYACARAGWSYTTDDASYLLRDVNTVRVRGRCTHFRFRPSIRQLFSELEYRDLTPRAEGKPSIEIPSDELAGVITAPEMPVYAFVELNRTSRPNTFLTPLCSSNALASMEESLFPLPSVREKQRPVLQRLTGVRLFTLHYRDLEPAVETLQALAEGRLG